MRTSEVPETRRAPIRAAWLAILDVALIGAGLCVFALFHHVLPRRLSPDLSLTESGTATVVPADEVTLAGAAGTAGFFAPSTTSWEGAAATVTADTSPSTDGQTEVTGTSYASDDIVVTLSTVARDGVTYYVEDIVLRDVTSLRTAFAEDTYGRSITDWTLAMATSHGAIAAINGDYYGASGGGVVIRNGHLYSATPEGVVCVLYADGTMKIYAAGAFDAEEAMAAGAWQAWDFGPALVEDGQALTQFRSRISGYNPRTAIGYYEPGHYCFVVVDGRQEDSDGMSLSALAALFQELGCKEAYNLDGGKSSAMVFNGSLVNDPADGGRRLSDIVYIAEVG